MLYLLDANVTITANSTYYPIDQVPEFWDWLQHQGESGRIKMPLEIWEEVKQGRKDDQLVKWISQPHIEDALLLKETVDSALVQRVVEAYAPDVTDDEVVQIGRDPFLIAYALASPADRWVVTVEASRPSALRGNRRVPDVCTSVGVFWCGPFHLNKVLGFRT
ncbi:MAG: DUF4411 family protein, partial [Acidobacteriaceae bacterium]|nr:DUF4411 family protein [Acidobacteriaceae bacterium]